jgi:autophagy-related protein 11
VSEADEQAFYELVEQLRIAQDTNLRQETQYRDERSLLETEIVRLKSTSHDVEREVKHEKERADHLERDLHHTRGQLESELAARRLMEHRQAELNQDIEGLRRDLSNALAEATAQTKVSEGLRKELVQAQQAFEAIKALESRNAAKIEKLLEDQAQTLKNLEDARAQGEDLEAQIQGARSESADVKRALADAGREKDRLLRAQATEHDRIMRDHIAEADGDRAVLEHQFQELKAIQEDTERRLKDAQSRHEVSCADAVGLRVELQRVEHELRDARHAERVLRDDLKAGRASQSDFEQKLESSSRLIAQILDVAIAFRNSHAKALSLAQSMTVHPGRQQHQLQQQSSAILAESGLLSSMRHSVIMSPEEPFPIDPSDPSSALDVLRSFDHDHFLEQIAKTGSTIKKWQKQCKEYRERAKGKISFRQFAKGDLALFLPTRNSVSKPWAAFNGLIFRYPLRPVVLLMHVLLVSFPHYFLQATGHLAEQLKTREWIVARITSIAERVVDQKVGQHGSV